MLPVYVASVFVLIGYFVVSQISGSGLSTSVHFALLDPLGGAAIDRLTRYWTPFQRNSQLIPLQGILLANRALWLGVGAVFFVVAYVKFAFAYPAEKSKRRGLIEEKEAIKPAESLPIAHPTFSTAASLRHLVSLTRIQFTETTKNVFFVVLMLAGFLLAIVAASGLTDPLANRTWPLTHLMVLMAGAGFGIFALAIIIFYSGELVWRERDAQLNQVMDAFPLQRWVLYCSKLLALMLVQVLVVLLIMAAGLAVQIAQGYYHVELGLYFRELFLNRLTSLWILCVLAIFIQTIVNNKYLGHFVMVLYIIATRALPPAGFQDYLYRFGESPTVTYSDINGYGPYLAAADLVQDLLDHCRDPAGDHYESSLGARHREQLARPHEPGDGSLFALDSCGCQCLCAADARCWRLHLLQHAHPESLSHHLQDRRRSRAVREEVSPVLVDAAAGHNRCHHARSTSIPKQRSASVSGSMWLENRTSSDIDRVAVTLWPSNVTPLPRPQHMLVKQISFAGGQSTLLEDPSLGFYIYKLPAPLPPQGRIQLDFSLQYDNPGFRQLAAQHRHRAQRQLSLRQLPALHRILAQHRVDRRQHASQARSGQSSPDAGLDDVAARRYNSGSFDADWINFDATVSTSEDQIAIAPGYLQKMWVENGRRYFHYKMDAPILNIYSIQSARYAVLRDQLERREPGDLLPARPRVQSRHHDAEHEGDAGLLHHQLQPLPVSSAAHHRVSRLRHLSPSPSPIPFRSPKSSASSPSSARSPMPWTCRSTSRRMRPGISGGDIR